MNTECILVWAEDWWTQFTYFKTTQFELWFIYCLFSLLHCMQTCTYSQTDSIKSAKVLNIWSHTHTHYYARFFLQQHAALASLSSWWKVLNWHEGVKMSYFMLWQTNVWKAICIVCCYLSCTSLQLLFPSSIWQEENVQSVKKNKKN